MTRKGRWSLGWLVVTALWVLFCYRAPLAPWLAGLGGLVIGATTVLVTVGLAMAAAERSGRK